MTSPTRRAGMARISAAEAQALLRKPKPAKYRNKAVVIDGVRYASQREAEVCLDLIRLEKAGKIGGLEFQRRFPILGPKGEVICTYVADACFWDHEQDRFRVIDVKGVETPVFKIKRKLVRAFLGIEIEVVR